MLDTYIIGSSGHAKVVIDAIESQAKYKIIGLVDDYRKPRETTSGYSIQGGLSDLIDIAKERSPSVVRVFIAVGSNEARRVLYEKLSIIDNIEFVSVIHPQATVSRSANVGQGCFIAARAIVAAGSNLEHQVIVNHAAIVDHDCHLGAFSSLAPQSALAGNVCIKANTFIGLGAVIIEKRSIAENCIVAANATVVKSVEEANSVVMGSPAIRIYDREQGKNYLK